MTELLSFEVAANLLTLTLMEIVLGIDNIVFIAICSNRLPESQQERARKIGLLMALITRLALLGSLVWASKLTIPLIEIFSRTITARDLVFIAGGLFLLVKGVEEIHVAVEGEEDGPSNKAKEKSFSLVICQIMVFDIIFSLDSVITAIGLSQEFWVMATAIIIAVVLMVLATESMSNFIKQHPTVKMLALSFLLLIGVVLIADGCGAHVPRGYLYFAIGFSIFVEFLNHLRKKRRQKITE